MRKTKYLAEAVLAWVKGGTDNGPSNIYLALLASMPSDDDIDGAGALTEVADANYTREEITLGAVTGTDTSTCANTGAITYPVADDDYSVAGWAIVNHETNTTWGTNVEALYLQSASPAEAVAANQAYRVPIGQLTVSEE